MRFSTACHGWYFLQDNEIFPLVYSIVPPAVETTGEAANQKCQITLYPLANSGLRDLAPLCVIYRPGGGKARGGLVTDIPLPYGPVKPDAMVDQFPAGIPGAGGRSC